MSLDYPSVVVDILLFDLLQHLLLRNPKVRQKLKLIVLMEEQHERRDVAYVREVETTPAVATFQVGGSGRADTLHPRLVQNPCQLGIDPQIDIFGHHVTDGFRPVLGIHDLRGEVIH